ncbi:MAG: hypothetical protein AAB507_02140 [Patescibacteria group bacterium]
MTEQNIKESKQISKLINKLHENKWVAFSSDYKKIIDYKEGLVELDKKVGDKDAVYIRVLPNGVIFAPIQLAKNEI